VSKAIPEIPPLGCVVKTSLAAAPVPVSVVAEEELVPDPQAAADNNSPAANIVINMTVNFRMTIINLPYLTIIKKLLTAHKDIQAYLTITILNIIILLKKRLRVFQIFV
jgi:hypothetical protein